MPPSCAPAARRHRGAIVVVAVVVVVVGAFSAAQLSGFVGKVGTVQASVGRLSSPVFPGEALGIWPKGDFRVVRGDVSLAYPAVALGLVAAALGALAAVRRRDWGLVAVGAAAVILYVGARLFASIYVDAKALAVMSPLVVVAAFGALFAPRLPGGAARYALGGIVAVALAASTFGALRAAPVGFDQRGEELESLAGLAQGGSVAFLGVDRFSGYWLRGTLIRSPGGYVPSEVKARRKKVWRKGLAMDLDTLSPRRLDDFDYAITTRAAYQSTAPPNFKPVVRTPSYVLWRRVGADAPAAGDRQGRHSGPPAGLRHPAGSKAVPALGHRDRDRRAGDGQAPRLEPGFPLRCSRQARRRASISAPGAGGSRFSTTARCRSPSRPPGRRWSCLRRSTGCTSPTRGRERSGRRARRAAGVAARPRSR